MDKQLFTAETAEEMFKVLNKNNYETALGLHDLGKSLDCKIEAKSGARNYKISYSKKKPSRVLFTSEFDNENFRVKANLFNIRRYKNFAESCSDTIKDNIKKTKECTHCNSRCANHPPYELDGKTHLPCYGSGHFFMDMNEKDWNDLKALIKYENEV